MEISYIPYLDYIFVITLHLSSAPDLCNSNNIILVMAYNWGEPEQAPHKQELGTVVHARRTVAKNRITTHYYSLVQWFMYKKHDKCKDTSIQVLSTVIHVTANNKLSLLMLHIWYSCSCHGE